MKKAHFLTGVIAFVTIAGGMICTWLMAAEEKVSIDQVPAAVKATIQKEAQGGTLREIERETKDGKTVYEAEVQKDGKEVEVKVAEDGTLLGREVEDDDGDDEDEDEKPIAIDQVPAKAREAILKHANVAKLTEVTQEEEDGVVLYEAEWSVAGRAHSLTVTADGTMVETEEDVDAKDVPPLVAKAAAKHLVGATGLKFEKKVVVLYEVSAKVNGKEREIVLTAAGQVAEDEDEGDDNDEEGEDDDK